MGSIKRLVEKNVPGVYVKSLKIGDTVAQVSCFHRCISVLFIDVFFCSFYVILINKHFLSISFLNTLQIYKKLKQILFFHPVKKNLIEDFSYFILIIYSLASY